MFDNRKSQQEENNQELPKASEERPYSFSQGLSNMIGLCFTTGITHQFKLSEVQRALLLESTCGYLYYSILVAIADHPIKVEGYSVDRDITKELVNRLPELKRQAETIGKIDAGKFSGISVNKRASHFDDFITDHLGLAEAVRKLCEAELVTIVSGEIRLAKNVEKGQRDVALSQVISISDQGSSVLATISLKDLILGNLGA
jgi:hypothetical protein